MHACDPDRQSINASRHDVLVLAPQKIAQNVDAGELDPTRGRMNRSDGKPIPLSQSINRCTRHADPSREIIQVDHGRQITREFGGVLSFSLAEYRD